jgi:hypothetical protein
MEVTPTKIRSSEILILVKVFVFSCYLNLVTYNFNALNNSQGVVDLSLQVYVPLKL